MKTVPIPGTQLDGILRIADALERIADVLEKNLDLPIDFESGAVKVKQVE